MEGEVSPGRRGDPGWYDRKRRYTVCVPKSVASKVPWRSTPCTRGVVFTLQGTNVDLPNHQDDRPRRTPVSFGIVGPLRITTPATVRTQVTPSHVQVGPVRHTVPVLTGVP